MRPSVALAAHRPAVREILARYPVANPRVYGPAASGTDREGGELHLLVDAGPEPAPFDLVNLQLDLEQVLGVSVDLTTPDELPARLRRRVLREARPV